jgi:alkaline phosphatase D
MYVKAPTKEQGQNLSPAFDLQFFGHVAIDGASEQMTVTLRDCNDVALWTKTLAAKRS